jgi:hypothetical protein
VTSARRTRRSWALTVAPLCLTLAACGGYSSGAFSMPEEIQHSHAPGEGHGDAHGHEAGHEPGHGGTQADVDGAAHPPAAVGDGLSATLRDFTLDAVRLDAGSDGGTLGLRILGPSGAPQLQYVLSHTKLMHLYLVSEDARSFQHLHPRLDASGYWYVDVPAAAPGRNRVVTEFIAVDDTGAHHALRLGTDVHVEGPAGSGPLPVPAGADTVDVGGYTVSVQRRGRRAAAHDLALTVRDAANRPARLLPFLESWAHVTAVRTSDLALGHLHPSDAVTAPTRRAVALDLGAAPQEPGTYRLFVEFSTTEGPHLAALSLKVR